DERRAVGRVGMMEALDLDPHRPQVSAQRVRVATLVPRVDVTVVHAPVADQRLQQLDDLAGARLEGQAVALSTHASMSLRAMLMPGGTIGRSSGRYQFASAISFSSIAMSPLAHRAVKPSINECGNGHGWLAT